MMFNVRLVNEWKEDLEISVATLMQIFDNLIEEND